MIICAWDGCFGIFITLVSSKFISMPQQLPISIRLSTMPCSTTYSLVRSTRQSAYFTVRISCPPILKPPKPSRASLVRYSLYQLNTIDDKGHPWQTPLPAFTILAFPWSSFTLTLRSKYKYLFKLLSTGEDDVPGDVLEILKDGYLRIVKQLISNMYKTAEWTNISLKVWWFS